MKRYSITQSAFVLLIGSAMLVCGCSTMQSIPVSARTKQYEADYLTVFRAVVAYCNDRSFAVTMADKDLGIVNTDYRENDGASKIFIGNTRAKINFSIRKTSDASTTVVLNVSAEQQGAFGSWTQMTMTEGQATQYYQQIFTGIQQQLGK